MKKYIYTFTLKEKKNCIHKRKLLLVYIKNIQRTKKKKKYSKGKNKYIFGGQKYKNIHKPIP